MLSRRENQVVALLMEGMSNKQIALALGVSERTVEFHFKNIYTKAGVASRVELILKLGNTAGGKKESLVESTVETSGRDIHNGGQPGGKRWATSLRNTVSLIKQETAMTLKILLEDLDQTLRNHSTGMGVLTFICACLAVNVAIYRFGLFFWGSYLVLEALLIAGTILIGRLLKSKIKFASLIALGAAVVIPFIAVAFDQLYISLFLRYADAISVSFLYITGTVEWVQAADGTIYRSTHLSITSKTLWYLLIAEILVVFFFSRKFGRSPDKDKLAVA
jgi:DNA-binding CsgD family transcriptional regulator